MKVWNAELEAIAQRWADQCGWAGSAHDDNRNKLDGTIVNIMTFATSSLHSDYYLPDRAECGMEVELGNDVWE